MANRVKVNTNFLFAMADLKKYVDSVKSLLKANYIAEAKEKLRLGLDEFPNRPIFFVPFDVFRASGDHKKSIGYARSLIVIIQMIGTYGVQQGLVALKRFDEAVKAEKGLEKIQIS